MSDSSADAHAEYLKFFTAQAKVTKADLTESWKRTTQERKKLYDAQRAALKVTEANVSRPEIAHPQGGIETISLSTAATADDLTSFYKKVDKRYKDIASQLIEVVLDDGRKVSVPVTPKKVPNKEKHTYHANRMDCPGKGFADILVREYDNYIVGFRVYSAIAERDSTRFCIFDEEIPTSFGEVHRTHYALSQCEITKAEFGAGILEMIFDFLNSLQQNPTMATSDQGQKYISALYNLFGEAQRFRIMREWAVRNVRSNLFVRPTDAMEELIRDWSDLSKVGFSLCLALLEVDLYMAYEEAYLAEGCCLS